MADTSRTRWLVLGIAVVAISANCIRVGWRSASAASENGLLAGEVKLFAGAKIPAGWAPCDGRMLDIAEQPKLFAALGTSYGGDGQKTFALPDLRGRVALAAGQGQGLSNYALGQKGGGETVTLTIAQMPSHRHEISANSGAGAETNPEQTVPSNAGAAGDIYSLTANVKMLDTMVGLTGGNKPFSTVQPYLALQYIIATDAALTKTP